MRRKKHPHKDIEGVLNHAEANGWQVVLGGSHAWGKMYCPYNDDECRCGLHCITSIWSTPKNPGNFAKQLRQVVDGCTTHVKATPKEN